MRKLMGLVLVAGFLWSGYWFIGHSAKYKVMSMWLQDRRAAGWTVDYSDFSVVGFPNRFDSRFKDLTLFDPRSGIGWQAPLFNILALSYQPNHIIAAFAHKQTLTLPHQTITVGSSKMMASVVFEPDTNLAVRRINLRAKDLTLNSSLGWKSAADSVAISTRQSETAPFAHEVEISAQKVTPTRRLRQNLDPNGQLPGIIDKVFLDMVLGFDAPWDRLAIEAGAPEVTRIDITRMSLGWGNLGLGAKGQMAVAKNGVITGKLSLKITNWRGVLDLFRSSGALDDTTAGTIARTVALLNSGAENPDNLTIPLTLAGGKMSLGPIPLGPAPRFLR